MSSQPTSHQTKAAAKKCDVASMDPGRDNMGPTLQAWTPQGFFRGELLIFQHQTSQTFFTNITGDYTKIFAIVTALKEINQKYILTSWKKISCAKSWNKITCKKSWKNILCGKVGIIYYLGLEVLLRA